MHGEFKITFDESTCEPNVWNANNVNQDHICHSLIINYAFIFLSWATIYNLLRKAIIELICFEKCVQFRKSNYALQIRNLNVASAMPYRMNEKTDCRYRCVRNRCINIRSIAVSMFSIRIIKIEIDAIGRRIPSRYSS